MNTPNIPIERLDEFFYLDGKNLRWKTDGKRRKSGDIAGNLTKRGYRYVRVDGDRILAHRIVWAMVNGCWPSGMIDHINGDKSDNRACNLRDVTALINQQNQRGSRSDGSTGYLGVTTEKKSKRNPFVAHIYIQGKKKTIGCFSTAEEAHEAYLKAKRDLHAGCTI